MEYTLYETKELAHRLYCPKFQNWGIWVICIFFVIFHFSFLVCKRAGDKPQGVLLSQRCHEPILECI
jgi:hypothetical protein